MLDLKLPLAATWKEYLLLSRPFLHVHDRYATPFIAHPDVVVQDGETGACDYSLRKGHLDLER